MIELAAEELVMLAYDLAKPFRDDPGFRDCKDSVSDLDTTLDDMRRLGHELEIRALQMEVGTVVSSAQSALRRSHCSERLSWRYDPDTFADIPEWITAWDMPGFSGLAHVLHIKFLQKHPHLLARNVGRFLKMRQAFVCDATALLKHLEIDVPSTFKGSQMFVPCAFARNSEVATELIDSGLPDVLGRSVPHVLYDAGESCDLANVNVHSCDLLGRTLLYLACRDRKRTAVLHLLNAGADPSARSSNGLWPLDVAAMAGDSATCSILLEFEDSNNVGARYDPNSSRSGRSPLMWAAFTGHRSIVELFRRTDNYSSAHIDRKQCTAIGLAAIRGHLGVVNYLIGCEDRLIDVPDADGRSPLWYAARGSHNEILTSLQTAGGSINRKDKDGFTPLAIASHEGHVDSVQHLLNLGSNVRAATNTGCTPLFLAASNRRKRCVSALLKCGPRVLGERNIQQAYEIARFHSYPEICEVLISPFPFLQLHQPHQPLLSQNSSILDCL